MSVWHLRQAARHVRAGGVIAYPTEGLWGLGCDPSNEAALQHLIALKNRPSDKGLILIASQWEQVQPWLNIAEAPAAAAACWPGHTTCLLPARDDVSPNLRGAHTTLAVRITAHPVMRALCELCDSALVSTSANRHGLPSPRTAWQVRHHFRDALDYILPGALGHATQASRIMDPYSGQILRP